MNMDDVSASPSLEGIPGFDLLSPEHQQQLAAMAENMRDRGLPLPLVESGLRSTASLLLAQQEEEMPRIQSDRVRAFIDANRGTPVARRSRAIPRKETKAHVRELLNDRLVRLLVMARNANRRHEMLRVRREMLGLDQGYIRRTLGQEGDRLCGEINEWLVAVATRLNKG